MIFIFIYIYIFYIVVVGVCGAEGGRTFGALENLKFEKYLQVLNFHRFQRINRLRWLETYGNSDLI